MQFIKYCMLFLVFILSNVIGNYIAKGYMLRLEELEEIKNALNIFKTKIKFTYEPIPEIFGEISENSSKNISASYSLPKAPIINEWDESFKLSHDDTFSSELAFSVRNVFIPKSTG